MRLILIFFALQFCFSGLAFSQTAPDPELAFPWHYLEQPRKFKNAIQRRFTYQEIPRFKPDTVLEGVVFENGYAKARIKNPQDWKRVKGEKIPIAVDIIYSKYPKDKTDWLTDYNELLSARLKRLFEIDRGINRKGVKYRLVLQTDCETEEDAKHMFHGIVVRYRLPEVEEEPEPIKPNDPDSVRSAYYSKKITRFIKRNDGTRDSIVVEVLRRNKQWKNMLVVMDWTGSMYGYGAQVALWHNQNFKRNDGVKSFVFFNDGDHKHTLAKVSGKTGGIYGTQAENTKQLLRLFRQVKSKGGGGDGPENDLEAIIKGVHDYPDFEEVILIADNNSCIRDFDLIDKIQVPVRVIVCGAAGHVNGQYVNLAYRTGGSVHTIEEDIHFMQEEWEGKTIKVSGMEYTLNKRDFLVSNSVGSTMTEFTNCGLNPVPVKVIRKLKRVLLFWYR